MATRLFNLNVKQLDSAIKILDDKLKQSKKDAFMTRKLQQMKNEYVKVENKILRYYDKARQKEPHLVEGKKNTLTLLDVLKLQKKDTSAYNLEDGNVKEAKWNYNFFDAVKDTKGLIVGTGATIVGIGAANLIANGITKGIGVEQQGIFPLLFKGLQEAFKFDAFGMSLLTIGGAAIGAALVIPKIQRKAHQIKNNIAHSREAANAVFKDLTKDEVFDEEKLKEGTFKDKTKESMVEELVNDPELLQHLKDKLKNKDLDGLSPAQKLHLQELVKAAEIKVKDIEKKFNTKKNMTEGEKEREKNEADKIQHKAEEQEVGNVADALKEFYETVKATNEGASGLDTNIVENTHKADLTELLNSGTSSYKTYALLVGDTSIAKRFQFLQSDDAKNVIKGLKDLQTTLNGDDKGNIKSDDLTTCMTTILDIDNSGSETKLTVKKEYESFLKEIFGEKYEDQVKKFLTETIKYDKSATPPFSTDKKTVDKKNSFLNGLNLDEAVKNAAASLLATADGAVKNSDLILDETGLGKIYDVITKKAGIKNTDFGTNGKLPDSVTITPEERAFVEAYHAKYEVLKNTKATNFGDADWKKKFDEVVRGRGDDYTKAFNVLKVYFGDDVTKIPTDLTPDDKTKLMDSLKSNNKEQFEKQVKEIIKAQKAKEGEGMGM